MYRLLSLKCAISLSKTLPVPTHKPLTTHVFTSPVKHYTHSWRSNADFSHKIHGALLNPVVKNRVLTRFSHTLLSKRVADCTVLFKGRGQFSKGNFGFSSLDSRMRRSWFQGMSAFDMVVGLIIANVGVFLLWRVADQKFMAENFMISLDNIRHGRLHTMITSAFSHIDAGHIIQNMIGLYFFGINIGNNFGPQFLLKLYLAGALGGSVFYLVHKSLMTSSQKGQGIFSAVDPSRTPALGASGAVNSIMLLDILLNPRATLLFDFFIPVPAILLGIYLIGSDIMRAIEGDSRISGSAHLGGAAVGALAWLRVRKGRF